MIDDLFGLIDAANAEGPDFVDVDGVSRPKEVLYSERMTAWLNAFDEAAPDTVRIAARAQHICRWTSPRSEFPKTRSGYYEWRIALGAFHADKTGELMASVGYEPERIERVKTLLRKEKIKADPDVQLLEDVICLVFIEHYLDDFSKDFTEERLIDIIRKTWRKMSDKGHIAAQTIQIPDHVAAVLEKALAD